MLPVSLSVIVKIVHMKYKCTYMFSRLQRIAYILYAILILYMHEHACIEYMHDSQSPS